MAVTIEYIREINQSKFYLDGVEIIPYDAEKSRMNPNSVCYGIQGKLTVSDYYANHAVADGSIQNFVYEENLTGQPLGALSVKEIQNNLCSE